MVQVYVPGRKTEWHGGLEMPWSARSWMHGWRALPFSPVFPAFAVNAFVFAIPFWLMAAAREYILNWRRTKANLCKHCGYPIVDVTNPARPCPECGNSAR